MEQKVTPLKFESKLPSFGKSIFSVMSGLANKESAINLSQGFPDFNCPDALVKLVNHYMQKGENQYAPMPGIMRLREKIAEKTESTYGHYYHPETEVTITAGATQAIYTAISAMINQGDEVIIFDPAYDCYLPAVLMNQGVPVHLKLEHPSYQINWDAVKDKLNDRTKMIIINSPHNPGASILSASDLKTLEKLTENTDIIVLSDEVYEHITFDGQQHQSVCRYPGLAERSLAIFSFGKTYHTTGWKMGYVLAPKKLTNAFRKIHQFMVFAANTPIQHAYADILDEPDYYESLAEFYENKRDIFRNLLSESRFTLLPCYGTYFQCLAYEKISNEKDTDFAKRLTIENKVASVPISVFYSDHTDHKVLRFCFAKSEETLKKAGDILCRI